MHLSPLKQGTEISRPPPDVTSLHLTSYMLALQLHTTLIETYQDGMCIIGASLIEPRTNRTALCMFGYVHVCVYVCLRTCGHIQIE